MAIALLNRPAPIHSAPIHDDATRRQFLIGGASLAALLTGCDPTARRRPPQLVRRGSL